MKIYTKTGDKGETSLLGGTRVSKAHERIESYGTIDELNSYIGLVRDQDVNIHRRDLLKEIQDVLFIIGSSLAADPEKPTIKKPDLRSSDVQLLEEAIDSMEKGLTPLTAFILPGGHPSVSFCHIARTVCRRAERNVIALKEHSKVEELIVIYLNRLSDYLFVLGRAMGKELKADEIIWKPRA